MIYRKGTGCTIVNLPPPGGEICVKVTVLKGEGSENCKLEFPTPEDFEDFAKMIRWAEDKLAPASLEALG